MPKLKPTFVRALGPVLVAASLAGCGDGGSGSSSAKWLHAADAQNNLGVSANLEALRTRSGPADKSCPALAERARQAIANPESAPSHMQVLVAPCNNAGLEFGKEVRCDSGLLQVKCI